MNQFVRTVTTGSPSTVASHVNRCAATRPGSIGPIGESIGAVATATSWLVRDALVEAEAELGGEHVDRLPEPGAHELDHRARAPPPRASCRTA